MTEETKAEIVAYDGQAPATADAQGQLAPVALNLPREKVELIKRTIAEDFTDDELELFLHQARRTGLDPLAKQIYAFKKSGRISIGAHIDGLRLTAARTGRYLPGSPTTYELDGKRLVSATAFVKVLHGNEWHEVSETAYFEEYTTGKGNWLRMPRVMTAKCAEARALRRAFPAELSGIYESSELDQMANEPAAPRAPRGRAPREPRAPRNPQRKLKGVIAQWATTDLEDGRKKLWIRIGEDRLFTLAPALAGKVEAAAQERAPVIVTARKSGDYLQIVNIELDANATIPAEDPPELAPDDAPPEGLAAGYQDADGQEPDGAGTADAGRGADSPAATDSKAGNGGQGAGKAPRKGKGKGKGASGKANAAQGTPEARVMAVVEETRIPYDVWTEIAYEWQGMDTDAGKWTQGQADDLIALIRERVAK